MMAEVQAHANVYVGNQHLEPEKQKADHPLPTNMFMNPIIRGFNPDPSVARVGEDFFLATSTFEYFPGVPIYHSKDLVNWKLIGHALTRRSQLDMRTVEPGAGIWAPTLRWRKDQGGENGRFYMTTCKWDRYRPQNDKERIFTRGFYVYTDNIWEENAWSEPIYFDNPGFDQDLFWDDDGKVYLSTTVRIANRPPNSKLKDFAIHISEIDLATGATLTAPKVIRSSPFGIAEGSHILKRGSFYYLFTAEGGTESGHQEWVLRSDKGPLGPWELGPRNPLWYNRPDEEVQNTGHVDVFDDAHGDWWAVMLGVRPRRVDGQWKESQLGRESYLVKVDWENNWPVFNEGKNISLLTPGRGVMAARVPVTSWEADFSEPKLERGWYTKHTPLKQFWSINSKENSICLRGGCYDLSSPESPSILLRKQAAFNEDFSAHLKFKPTEIGSEAGIVVWYSMYAYASIGIRRHNSGIGLEVVVRTPNTITQNNMLEEKTFPLDNYSSQDELPLYIHQTSEFYSLGIPQALTSSLSSDSSVYIDHLMSPPPVGGMFTGTSYGIYSFGKCAPCLDPAVFSKICTTA